MALLLSAVFLGSRGIAFLWDNRFMVWVGNISFEFFLIHSLTIQYVLAAAKKLQLALPPSLLSTAAIAIGLLLAAGVHRYRTRSSDVR